MRRSAQHDFDLILKQALELIEKDKSIRSLQDVSSKIGIKYTTFASGMRRNFNVNTFEDLKLQSDVVKYKIEGGADGDTIEIEIDGNFGNVRAVDVSGQIRTVEQLLKAAKIDTSVWETVQPDIRKWDVVLKLRDADADIVRVVPSFYVGTKIRRIEPMAFEPVVHPVEVSVSFKKPKQARARKDAVRRALVVNDPQVGFRRRLHTNELTPFHDRRVLDLALQIAESEEIDHISFGGDCLDLSEWSGKFTPEPEFFWTTQPAVIEWAWWLAQFRGARENAEMKALEGNHDARLGLLIVANMRQAYRLKPVDELALPPSLSVPRLLALHQLQVEYVGGYPDNGYWLNRNVFISHGDVVRSAPGATANEISKRQAFTTIFGHIHRRELVARRMKLNEGDLIYSAFCPGCACHIDGRLPGSSSTQQWQQGIAVIEYTENDETIIPISIQDGRMMYNGRMWQARERDGEVNAMLIEKLEQVS